MQTSIISMRLSSVVDVNIPPCVCLIYCQSQEIGREKLSDISVVVHLPSSDCDERLLALWICQMRTLSTCACYVTMLRYHRSKCMWVHRWKRNRDINGKAGVVTLVYINTRIRALEFASCQRLKLSYLIPAAKSEVRQCKIVCVSDQPWTGTKIFRCYLLGLQRLYLTFWAMSSLTRIWELQFFELVWIRFYLPLVLSCTPAERQKVHAIYSSFCYARYVGARTALGISSLIGLGFIREYRPLFWGDRREKLHAGRGLFQKLEWALVQKAAAWLTYNLHVAVL